MACPKEDKIQLTNKGPLHICFIDLNIIFTKEQVDTCIRMYNKGCDIQEIAKKIRPHDKPHIAYTETTLLIYDLAELGKLTPRELKYTIWREKDESRI